MNADKLTRITAVAAVLAVAVIAAVISYGHAVAVVTAHGEAGTVGHLYPVVIDGLIIAASMVLLDAARHREPAPPLAWLMLAVGIAGTLAVNVLAGTASGPLGSVVAAWPALAFVGAYELVMMLVRAAARRAPVAPLNVPETVTPGTVPSIVPSDAESPALIALRATLAAGNGYSNNQLMTKFGLTRAQVTKVRQQAQADANGHQPDDATETPVA